MLICMAFPPTRSVAWSRPVAIPDDVDDPMISKASGVVELPHNVRWSPPFRSYDLDDLADRLSVYAQVMTEGNEDDVRRFIEPAEVVRLWDELVLSPHVREAWESWLTENGYFYERCALTATTEGPGDRPVY